MTTATASIWDRAAAEFDVQAETIRKRWSRYVDRIPGATDPDICSEDEYVALLISFGRVATSSKSLNAREEWVTGKQNHFAAKLPQTTAPADTDVIDIELDDLLDSAQSSSALALAQRNQTTLTLAQSGLEDAYAELCFVVDKLKGLHTAPTGKTELEKDAIATQRLTQELKDETEIQVRMAKMRQALLGNAAA